MKKLILSLVAAIVGTTASFAQSSLLATLSHEGNITTYYGASALREAHAAAVDGDIITLSSGSFTSVKIEKGITIRGAGMAMDAATQSEPTIIVGDFDIAVPAESATPLTIEGIYNDYFIKQTTDLKNATFLKCRFSDLFTTQNSTKIENLTMIHCKVAKEIVCPSNSTISCLNCALWNVRTKDGSSSVFEMTNCVIQKGNVGSELYSSTFKNCIFIGNNGGDNFFNYTSGPNAIYNCLWLEDNSTHTPFRKIQNTTNKVLDYAAVFKTCKNGTYSDSETFELTADCIVDYKGNDGTQVGIYGGSMPFSITPSNPQITKCNVAAKSTADGKLSVDITVQGAE